jgi:ribosomal protein S18 acetylase RimI-like enzyme
MLQSSITAWLKKPASVAKSGTSNEPPRPAEGLDTPAAETPLAVPASHPPQVARKQTAAVVYATIANGFSLKPLPPNVEFVPLTDELMPAFKRLNSLLLPIAYPATFYTETMTEPHHSVTLMALWHPAPLDQKSPSDIEKPRLIGAIRCRVLPYSNLYISTIGILSPYRSHGIATHLLHRIAAKASEEHGAKCITAHVWEANEDGLEWYKKRGFEIIGKEEGYYRKLKPSGAVLVRRWISIGDLLEETGA